jgi:hypothetical protein
VRHELFAGERVHSDAARETFVGMQHGMQVPPLPFLKVGHDLEMPADVIFVRQ